MGQNIHVRPVGSNFKPVRPWAWSGVYIAMDITLFMQRRKATRLDLAEYINLKLITSKTESGEHSRSEIRFLPFFSVPSFLLSPILSPIHSPILMALFKNFLMKTGPAMA